MLPRPFPPAPEPITGDAAGPWVLGLSAFYHDSAACLVRGSEIVAAAQEERFSRIKGDDAFPAQAAAWCLDFAGIQSRDLAAVAFYEKPLLRFDRILETFLALAPRGFQAFRHAGPLWMHDRLRVAPLIREGLNGYDGCVLFVEHHASHAASAFYPSPFTDAAILTIDGVGEWATATISEGHGNRITTRKEMHWPDSLGLLYSAFTYHCGFKVNSGEYKLMGLAPYGRPRYTARLLDQVIDLRDDGSFRLNQTFFNYLGGLTMTSNAFSALFDGPPRSPDAEITQREMDLARSVQDLTEEIVLRMARSAHKLTGSRYLCMAGGVALNAVANGRVRREGPFDEIWVQPAAGDAGGAIGAALLASYEWNGTQRAPNPHDSMQGTYLGPSYDGAALAAALDLLGARAERMEDTTLIDRTADLLADGKVIGWFDGRMEFGPRSLGARSILADPRNPQMQSDVNLKIKFRESFRPFAPSVLAERASEYFDLGGESPYMLQVAPVAAAQRCPIPADANELTGLDQLKVQRSRIPAVTHVDGSARPQTVTPERTPRLHALLRAFESRTGVPVLINTSFNVRGEPIVCAPEDAYACFMQTGIDYLVMPPYILEKSAQPHAGDLARWQRPIGLD